MKGVTISGKQPDPHLEQLTPDQSSSIALHERSAALINDELKRHYFNKHRALVDDATVNINSIQNIRNKQDKLLNQAQRLYLEIKKQNAIHQAIELLNTSQNHCSTMEINLYLPEKPSLCFRSETSPYIVKKDCTHRNMAIYSASAIATPFTVVRRYQGDKIQRQENRFHTVKDVYRLYKKHFLDAREIFYLLDQQNDKNAERQLNTMKAIARLAKASFGLDYKEFECLTQSTVVEDDRFKLSFSKPLHEKEKKTTNH